MKTRSLRPVMLIGALLLAAVFGLKTPGQEGRAINDASASEKWEYLVLAGASSTNFSATGNPRMRKDAMGTFAREAFVLEQHLDKLGANGWELLAVTGPPSDPVYYFKRRKWNG